MVTIIKSCQVCYYYLMTATGHAIIGTVIAAKIGNPTLAIPLAMASHLVADMIPHWDVATNRRQKGKDRVFKEAIVDELLGFVLGYLLIQFLFPQTNLIYAFIIIIFAQIFDWLFAPYYFFGVQAFKWAYDFGKKTNKELDKPWGIINQIALIAALVVLAKVF